MGLSGDRSARPGVTHCLGCERCPDAVRDRRLACRRIRRSSRATRPASYGDLADHVARRSPPRLIDAGVEPGDRVAIFLRRGADAAACFFGVLAAGAVAVIVNELLRPRQIEHILAHSGAVALLTSDELSRAPPAAARDLGPRDRPRRSLDLGADADRSPAPTATWPRSSTPRAPPGCRRASRSRTPTSGPGMRAVTEYLRITAEDRIASLLRVQLRLRAEPAPLRGRHRRLPGDRALAGAGADRPHAGARSASRCSPACRRCGCSCSRRTTSAPDRSTRCG